MLLSLLASAMVLVPSFEIDLYPGPRLLRVQEVYEDLGMSRVQVSEFMRRYRRDFNQIQLNRYPLLSLADRRVALRKIVAGLPLNIRSRLGQIYVQTYGITAGLDRQVQVLLKLSDSQIRAIQRAHEDAALRYQNEQVKSDITLQRVLTPTDPHKPSTKAISRPLTSEGKRLYNQEMKRLDQVWLKELDGARHKSMVILAAHQRARFVEIQGKPMSKKPHLWGPTFSSFSRPILR